MSREQDIEFIEKLRKEDNVNAIDMIDDIILQSVNAYKQKVREAIKTLLYLYMRDCGISKEKIKANMILKDLFEKHTFSLVQLERQAEELCKEELRL